VVQQTWAKFNANERLAAIGALVIFVGWVVTLVGSYGFGSNIVALLGAIGVLAVLYLKYAPNQNITWPAPVPLILLAISAIVGLIELLSLLQVLQFLGLAGSLFGMYFIGSLVTIVGAAIMLWGSYQEWNTTKAAAPPPPGPPTPPAPPTMPGP
jgi:hypothetical protein